MKTEPENVFFMNSYLFFLDRILQLLIVSSFHVDLARDKMLNSHHHMLLWLLLTLHSQPYSGYKLWLQEKLSKKFKMVIILSASDSVLKLYII